MKRLVCVIAIGCLMLCLTGCGTPASTEPEKDYSMETIREEVYGVNSLVKLADGTEVTAICFDNAATTPAFKDVNEEVVEKLGTYSTTVLLRLRKVTARCRISCESGYARNITG